MEFQCNAGKNENLSKFFIYRAFLRKHHANEQKNKGVDWMTFITSRKKLLIKSLVCLLILIVPCLTVVENAVAAAEYRTIYKYDNYPVNKVWRVTFNMALDPESVNDASVYVVDSENKRVDIQLKLTDDNKTIEIIPVENYEYDEFYSIFITSQVKSCTNKSLKEPVRVIFNTVSGSSHKVYGYQDLIDVLRQGYDFEILNDEVARVYYRAKEILEEIIKPGMTDLEKELAIYHYILDHTEYDHANYLNDTISDPVYHAYNLLFHGVSVCNGYAETTALLLNMAGIEAYFVTGMVGNEPHAWNIVKIDGEYYHLDTTLDDPFNVFDRKDFNYFNISDEVMKQDHKWDELRYPKCTDERFAFIREIATRTNKVHGYFYGEGNWLYFDKHDGSAFSRIRLDGSKMSKLTDNHGSKIQVVGDWVYYINNSDYGKIYRMRLDGSDDTKIVDERYVYSFAVHNDHVYFVNMAQDGIYKKKISGGPIEKLVDGQMGDLAVKGDTLYYKVKASQQLLHRLDLYTMSDFVMSEDEVRKYRVDGDWMYYVNKLDGDSLYRIKADGTSREKLTESSIITFIVDDEAVYYTTFEKAGVALYRLDKGKAKPELILLDDVNDLYEYNGDIYYSRTFAKGLFKLEKGRGEPVQILDCYPSYILFRDGYVYYSNSDDNHAIYRTSLSNGRSERLTANSPGEVAIEGDWLYYRNYSSGMGNISAVNLKTGEERDINQVNSAYICPKGDWIVFCSFFTNADLAKVRTDGSQAGIVTNDQPGKIAYDGEWIYYIRWTDKDLYRIRLDGTSKQLLVEGDIYDFELIDNKIYYITNGTDYMTKELKLQ